MRKHILMLALCLSASPAFAQIDSEIPQYSGIGARIDYGMTGHGSLPAPRTNPAEAGRNDRGFEASVGTRQENIQGEMEWRRDEAIRANQQYILQKYKTNE